MTDTGLDTQVKVKETPRKRRNRLLWGGIAFILIVILGIFGLTAYVGWNLTHPVREAVNTTPAKLGIDYENVAFTSKEDHLRLKGWLLKASGSKKTVIFAHGYGRNRLQKDVPALSIASQLVARGYNVLMFDFRNSGDSAGKLTSVGQFEVLDLQGAVEYIQGRPEGSDKIILYGFSMGAATSIMAGARETAVDGVIADSPFADLKTYLMANLSVWTNLPSFPFNQTFLWVVPPMTGLRAEEVSPVKEVENLKGRPLLLIHGYEDDDIPMKNSEAIKKAYPIAHLVRIKGADHVGGFGADEKLYMSEVLRFLDSI